MTNQIEELFKKGVVGGTFGRQNPDDGTGVFVSADQWIITGNRKGNQAKITHQVVEDSIEECFETIAKRVDEATKLQAIIT